MKNINKLIEKIKTWISLNPVIGITLTIFITVVVIPFSQSLIAANQSGEKLREKINSIEPIYWLTLFVSLQLMVIVWLTYERSKIREILEKNNTLMKKQKEEIEKLKTYIDELDAKKQKEEYTRFENIEKNIITYGYIPFWPTLFLNNSDPDPKGLGVDLLNKIFSGNCKAAKKRSTWDDAITRLNREDYDIIATPMYDISERRHRVLFSSPIFYTDIGIFTATNNLTLCEISRENGANFEEIKRLLEDKQNELAVTFCLEELQDKMTKKYCPSAKREEIKRPVFSIPSALDGLTYERGSEGYTDLFFCERIQAEKTTLYKHKKIINLLKPGQMLLPVCLAIRRGEDTLRKYINFRLMNLEANEHSGLMQIYEESMSLYPEKIDIKSYMNNSSDLQ